MAEGVNGAVDGKGIRGGRMGEGFYFAELVRVDDETAAFFGYVLHCCCPGGEVVGVGGDPDSVFMVEV